MNLELAQVDVRSLKSVSLEQRKKLPNLAGIYFVLNSEQECLYVGMTESLVLRWLNHHKLKDLQKLVGVKIAWLEWEDTKSLDQAESFFIKALRPLLNIRGLSCVARRSSNCSVNELRFTDEQNKFLNLSYRDLKRMTGIDVKNWSDWLNGKSSPSLSSLERIADAWGMSLFELIEIFLERRSRTIERNASKHDAA